MFYVYLNNSIRSNGDGTFSENFNALKDYSEIVELQEISKDEYADQHEAITNETAFNRQLHKRLVLYFTLLRSLSKLWSIVFDFFSINRSISNNCGTTLVQNSLIVGGESTKLGEWPWLASIHIKYDFDLDFRCPGTLISDSHVITGFFPNFKVKYFF